MHKVLQWNCQGYSAKYEDLKLLLSTHYPSVVLLQESMLNDFNSIRPPTGYSIYNDFNNPLPANGLVTLMRKDIPHRKIDIQTNLQATAFRVNLQRQYTVCIIYISANTTVQLNDIHNLIDQLPTPVTAAMNYGTHRAHSNALDHAPLKTSY